MTGWRLGWLGRLLRVHSPSGHLSLTYGCWCQRLARPRWVQRAWARVFGYFWAPCPRCGVLFGGHETAPGGVHVDLDDGSFVVCRVCGPKVTARLRERLGL